MMPSLKFIDIPACTAELGWRFDGELPEEAEKAMTEFASGRDYRTLFFSPRRTVLRRGLELPQRPCPGIHSLAAMTTEAWKACRTLAVALSQNLRNSDGGCQPKTNSKSLRVVSYLHGAMIFPMEFPTTNARASQDTRSERREDLS